MKATKLLKMQHDEVSALFKKIEASDNATKRAATFRELAAKLVAHDAIEREIFYPACEETLGMNDILGEALVEHGVVEFSLFKCEQHIDGEEFMHYVTVLKEVVEHHVKEEEDEFFKMVEKAFDDDELEDLGDEMETRFAEALGEDYVAALKNNLQQVLFGATKTTPAKELEKMAKPEVAAKGKKSNGAAAARPR